MDMVNASVAKEQLDELVETMMAKVGGKDKDLTLEDFQSLMQNYQSELSDASLHMPGTNSNRCSLTGCSDCRLK